jgi:hypothetical protein
VENLVLSLRRELKDTSDLGEFGAAAIRRTLQDRGTSAWKGAIEHESAVRTVSQWLC